jgi:hypothetical protein
MPTTFNPLLLPCIFSRSTGSPSDRALPIYQRKKDAYKKNLKEQILQEIKVLENKS